MTLRRTTLRWMAAIGIVGLLTACGHTPDTTLNPTSSSVTYAPLQHPFPGATLVVDPATQANRWQAEHDAGWLDPITEEPQARWLNGFDDLPAARTYLQTARKQDALPVFVVYAIPNRGCSGFKEGVPFSDYDTDTPRGDSYHAFVSDLVATLGPVHAVIVLEPDAVPADCFDDDRAQALRGAVTQLEAAGQYVYVDAGHPGWVPSGVVARRLLQSGVEQAEGVSLNVSNRYPTDAVAEFGEELSELIGSRDYVVDSSRNGPEATTENIAGDWCNRSGQSLGTQQTTTTDAARFPHMAAQLWIKPPGESDGNNEVFPNQDCHGETAPPGVFSPRQGRELILNDPTQPASVHRVVAALSDDGSKP